jgi:hypothetical protein
MVSRKGAKAQSFSQTSGLCGFAPLREQSDKQAGSGLR